MTSADVAARILAIDIGATSMKSSRTDERGQRAETVKRRSTPSPCTPDRLVEVVVDRIKRSGCARVGVGFPGECRDGVVVAPGNLSRRGGVGTPIDEEIDQAWRGFAFETALRDATEVDVRVVNDAALAALGCSSGRGTELVITLGTGCGLALVRDGALVPVRDLGEELFVSGLTYDEALGERARATDAAQWVGRVIKAVGGLSAEFSPDVVLLAGGNARRVSPSVFEELTRRVVIIGNDAPLRGAAKLFS